VRDRIDAWFARLADLQVRRPSIPLACVLAISVLGAWLALHLELRTRFDQLLPESQPSVVALRRVEKRTASAQTAMILLEGDDEAALRRLGDAIVPKMLALGPDVVASAEDGVHEARDFLRARGGLFLELGDLEKLASDVDARWDWEVTRGVGASIDDSPPPPFDRASLEKRFSKKTEERFRDGWYERDDGKALVVVVRSPVPLGDLDRVSSALDRMHAAVAEAQTGDLAKIRVTFTGDMVAGLVEYGAVRDDLLHVGAMGVALVLGVVLLYFMRLRALVVMACTIACGLACTFGLTEVVIGHLNIATGFLFSIVAGNGINVGILWLSRYYEEKADGASTADAVRTAHRTTWPSTAVAAIASAAAYSSLAVTAFRTFQQFALIGAGGMVMCWLVTIALLPALLVLFDGKSHGRRGIRYGAVFATIVPKAPRLILIAGTAVAIGGAVCAARYIASDPMEYDLTRIQNDMSQSAELHRGWRIATEILGKTNDAMVVLADKPAQAEEVRRILRKRWADAPANAKPFEAVHSIFDFIPEQQEKKVPTLLHVGERLRRAHARGLVQEEDWKHIAPLLPPEDLVPFGIADLPAGLARAFTEKDGTRGTLVLVEPGLHDDTNDLHYLLRYSASFRETRLADGTVLEGAGRALVFADILDAVVTQVPRAIALAFVLTLLAVLITFRRGAHSISVLGALFVGFAGVAGFLYFAHVRLNFLNNIALPITFGIGVDYAVNVMQRYEADGSKDILAALRTTGGAVVLCSLTTTLGYFALIGSHNQAIRSLGVVAVVGEISCLLAAVLVLPAGWYRRERMR
jgi:hypothetical protein